MDNSLCYLCRSVKMFVEKFCKIRKIREIKDPRNLSAIRYV